MRPLRTVFIAFGFFWGTWAVAAFDIQRFLEFSDAQLGLLLVSTVVGGVFSNAAGGVLAERHGTRSTLATSLLVWAVLLAVLASITNRAGFCAAFVLTVSGGGMVDVTMNVACTAAVGSSPRRMLRMHSLFNAGAVIGAATAGVVLGQDISFRALWAAMSVIAVVLSIWVRRTDMPAGEKGEHYTLREGLAALRKEGLATLAIAFALGAMVEGGIDTWGVLFLRAHLGLAVAAGAGAYVAGQTLATTARNMLGWTAEHIGERRGAQLGLVVAGAGLLLEATSTSSVPASIGLGAAAVGAAVYWPLLLSYASQGAERPGVIVGGLSAAGYVGFLAGPPIVGWVAEATDLRWGLAFLGAAAFAGAALRLRVPASHRAQIS